MPDVARRDRHPSRDWVALTLAVGLATALNLITLGVLINALNRSLGQGATLSENATQLLTAAFGGITGILGGYIGFRAAESAIRADADARADKADQRAEIEAATTPTTDTDTDR